MPKYTIHIDFTASDDDTAVVKASSLLSILNDHFREYQGVTEKFESAHVSTEDKSIIGSDGCGCRLCRMVGHPPTEECLP